VIRFVFALAGVLWLSPVLLASDTLLDYTRPTPPASPSFTGHLVRLVGLTVASMAFLVIMIWMTRRRNRIPNQHTSAGRMEHEGTLQLDRRCAVHMIRVDGQSIAITTDATGLRSVVVLSEPFGPVLQEATETVKAKAA